MAPNEELVTVAKILEFLRNSIEHKVPLSPSTWVDAAAKLNILLGDENDAYHDMQQQVALMKVKCLNEDPNHNVSAAKLVVEASDAYCNMRKQESKIKLVIEAIRISKVQARIRMEEFHG